MSKINRPYIGVEIGATKLQVALGTAQGGVVEMLRETAHAESGAHAILDQVVRMVRRLCVGHDVAAVGVGFGGPVDEAGGRAITSHQVVGWDDIPLVRHLEEACGHPCVLDNDANCAALAEAIAGAGKGFDATFYTNIGSGIGGGLVIQGSVYAGRLGSMEIGHTWVDSKLEGHPGRLEDLCSGWAIARRARKMSGGGASDQSLDNPALGTLDAEETARRWLSGDPAATRLMEDVIDSFAQALCNVIALLNPPVIVVGGGVALIGSPLISGLTASVRRQLLFKPFAENFTIMPAHYGEDAVPVGALLLAARDGFKTP